MLLFCHLCFFFLLECLSSSYWFMSELGFLRLQRSSHLCWWSRRVRDSQRFGFVEEKKLTEFEIHGNSSDAMKWPSLSVRFKQSQSHFLPLLGLRGSLMPPAPLYLQHLLHVPLASCGSLFLLRQALPLWWLGFSTCFASILSESAKCSV